VRTVKKVVDAYATLRAQVRAGRTEAERAGVNVRNRARPAWVLVNGPASQGT
jgi:hypothetical protein